ncbi:hypothetical protein CTI12_AA626130 [Artemisia annua]|uniref:KIB1-4 beta-propeller domain-containing protein n=1 Tax=Artemisia annua TaxID=35608 RepID=A0A2U1KAB4_ARTAN|nr:hypothetical protein CTI12_AA626130 [Artemisia annua]
MEQISSGSVCDRLPPLSAKYPWLVAQSLEDEENNIQDMFFYTIHNELSHYRCRIPELLGERIRGCFHGWLILSNHPNNNKWSLWKPSTSKIIRLPTLILEDAGYESISECCLSAPPTDPSSILLLTRTNKPTFVFFRLVNKRKKFRWIEMSYAYQLKRLTFDGKLVNNLTYCNGKVYALSFNSTFAQFILHVEIVVWDKEVVIKLMLFGACPFPPSGPRGGDWIHYLKGVSTKLFYIRIYFEDWGRRIPLRVFVFKSDMACIDWEKRECLKYWDLTDFNHEDAEKIDYEKLDLSSETWEVIDDLKNATFFVDLGRDHSVSYRRVIASDAGGFIHIRGEMGKIIYSYHVKTDTISLFHIPSPMLPTSHLSLWECRLKGDHGEAKCIIDSKVEMKNNNDILLRSGMVCGVKSNESHLLNVPFHILETIMKFSVGVEYMNLRATSKQCHLAAPLVKWRNDTSLGRLQTYSVVSPWLMVVDKKRGVMTFTDPMLGGNYFLKNSRISIVYGKLYCSKFGWLLFKSYSLNCLVFFNPFTNVVKDLPDAEYSLKSLCFSAPPTSLDCMVVGFSTREYWRVDILYVNREPTWRTINLCLDPHTVCYPTFYGRDLYALCKEGELLVISNLDKEDCCWKLVEAEAPKGSCTSSTQYFLTNCDQHLLLVSLGEYGGHVEVFKRYESKQEWEKLDCIGKHMIFVCGTTCLCIEAKVPKMENKIFFPRLHTKNRKVVFYSLDTCKYHTFDGESVQEHVGEFFGTTYYLSRNAWIEPSWS